jgi:hypothetical protein
MWLVFSDMGRFLTISAVKNASRCSAFRRCRHIQIRITLNILYDHETSHASRRLRLILM